MVINADDYYGKEAYTKMHEFLIKEQKTDAKQMEICMAGFVPSNTSSDKGTVTRGVCQMDAAGFLTGIEETHNIKKTPQGPVAVMDDGSERELDVNSLVSMNMWGLQPEFWILLC